MKPMKLPFFSDPGHGWLRVPVVELAKAAVMSKISRYSYMNGKFVYLEEDCDAVVFVDAVRASGREVQIDCKMQSESPSKIRSYSSYSCEAALAALLKI